VVIDSFVRFCIPVNVYNHYVVFIVCIQKLGYKIKQNYRFSLRLFFIDLGIGTSVLTFIPVSPLLDHK